MRSSNEFHYTDAWILAKTSCVVIDGVTVEHPCCAVHNCKTPLASNCHRFCPDHELLNQICAVIGCNRPVAGGRRVCEDKDHVAVEKAYDERGQSCFQLQQRLCSARMASGTTSTTANPDDEAAEEEFDVDKSGEAIPSANVEVPHSGTRKLWAQFGRKRTHNEQIIVAPCGVIIARATFYSAEAVHTVAVCFISTPVQCWALGSCSIFLIQEFIKCTYHGTPFIPDHIFFDNNCSLKKAVAGDPFFKNISLTVDVFHFKSKHSGNDLFCQLNCNPVDFPELLGENRHGWFFNSSIAEQTNAWLANYHSICREMHADRFNFFLDEMIMRRNRNTLNKLTSQGAMPDYWSADMF